MRKSFVYINFSANALGSMISALTMLLVMRDLSVADWGLSAALLGVGQFLGGALSFGSQTRVLRDLSAVEASTADERAGGVSLARLGVGILMLVIGALVNAIVPFAGAVIILMAGVFVSVGATAPLIARRRYLLAGGILLLEKLFALGVAVVLIHCAQAGLYALPVAIGLAGIVAGGLATGVLLRRGQRATMTVLAQEVRGIWRGSLHFGIAAIAPSALLLDVSIVSMFAGTGEAGLYAAGSRLTAPLSIAATTIVQVLMPILAATEVGRLSLPPRRHIVYGAVTLIGGAAVLVLILPPAVILVLGASYEPAADVIRLFIVNAMIILFTRTLVTVLQSWRRESLASALVVMQVVLALIGIFLASAFSGSVVAAGALVASNIALSLALVIAVRRLWIGRENSTRFRL